jgi:hypothetical protein
LKSYRLHIVLNRLVPTLSLDTVPESSYRKNDSEPVTGHNFTVLT